MMTVKLDEIEALLDVLSKREPKIKDVPWSADAFDGAAVVLRTGMGDWIAQHDSGELELGESVQYEAEVAVALWNNRKAIIAMILQWTALQRVLLDDGVRTIVAADGTLSRIARRGGVYDDLADVQALSPRLHALRTKLLAAMTLTAIDNTSGLLVNPADQPPAESPQQ